MMMRKPGLILMAAVLGAGCLTAGAAHGQERRGGRASPEIVPFTRERMQKIQLPAGFHLSVFARLAGEPRMIEVADDGTVYITRRDQGDVLALKDMDGDGEADQKRTVARGLDSVHGILLHKGKVYLAAVRKIWVAPRREDGSFGKPELIVDDLPPNHSHRNRTLAIGPEDGKLYVTIGSNGNDDPSRKKPFATLMRMNPDGSNREIFARGLRNTIGFGFHPETGQLWGMDHGTDWRGDNTPFEELNHLKQGGDYGWPWVYGKRNILPLLDAEPPGGGSVQEYADRTVPATLTYQAHSAPIQLAYYTGDQFPPSYRNDAFVAMHGSWNRKPPIGPKLVRIRFNQQNQPVDFQDFATGWQINHNTARFGRPAGVAVAKDGSLLVGDDTNGVIYRISYTGDRRAPSRTRNQPRD